LGGGKWGGQLMLTTMVENYPGFPDGILGPDLMELFKKQAERFGAEVKLLDATKVDFQSKPFKIWADEEYQARAVIVATGAETVWLAVPGEKELIGRGVSSCAPCDAFFFKGKKVLVVGGGDSAMEEAITLAKFATEVIIVHRRSDFRASEIMQKRVFTLPNVKVIWNACIAEISGKEKVTGVRFRSMEPARDQAKDSLIGVGNWQKVGEDLVADFAADGVFVAIGHAPNTKLFEGQIHLDQKGYVLRSHGGEHQVPVHGGEEVAHEHFRTMSSVPGVFVAGDVHDHHYKQAVTAAGYGCEAALEVGRFLDFTR